MQKRADMRKGREKGPCGAKFAAAGDGKNENRKADQSKGIRNGAPLHRVRARNVFYRERRFLFALDKLGHFARKLHPERFEPQIHADFDG